MIALRPLGGRACSICFCLNRAILSAMLASHACTHVSKPDIGGRTRTCKDGAIKKCASFLKKRTRADGGGQFAAGTLSASRCYQHASVSDRVELRLITMRRGIDRIVMLLCGVENLRKVTLFPINRLAEDLMMGAPSEVSPRQLRELHIRVVKSD